MKTFNYESNCVKYKNCFFDLGEYEKGKLSLAIYGYVEDDKNLSHISNVTVNVEEKLEENQVVIDNYANSNLISFLLDLGIVKNIPKKVTVKFLSLYKCFIYFVIYYYIIPLKKALSQAFSPY